MSKKIYQYTLEGKLVKPWDSISDAAKVMGCNESSIRRAIKNKTNSCNFMWFSYILQGTDIPAIIDNIITYGTTYHPKDVAFKEDTKEKLKKLFAEAGSKDRGLTKLVGETAKSILVIGDLHAPFIREGYLQFCKSIYDKYNCNTVIFIGDLIDNHFSSFHDTDPDGHGAAEELRLAKLQIAEWYKTFPAAKVCIGNHDLIPIRKAFNTGLSKIWVKSVSEVLNTPNWKYDEEFVIDEVLYVHGTGRKAVNRMQADLISVVQGHYHSESYIQYAVGKFKKLFAMQLGCGVDDKSYAMAYGKHFDKMHINCGVVLEDGKLPILEYMNL